MQTSFKTPWQVALPEGLDKPLEQALEDLLIGDFQLRWEAAKRLSALGEKAIPSLLNWLRDEDLDGEVRWFAARILGDFDQPEVVAALIQLFAEVNDEELRQGIADALTRIGASSIRALGQLLSDPALKGVAARALAHIHHSSTIAPLLSLAQDQSADLRALAIEALGRYSEPSILPILQQALRDPIAKVRVEAVRALRGQRTLQPLEDLVNWLEPCLYDGVQEVGEAAIALLGRLPTARSIELLTGLVQAPTTPPTLQKAALQALGWMEVPAAMEALLTLWPQVSETLHRLILTALSCQTLPELKQRASQSILAWLTTLGNQPQHNPLRQEGALALGQLGCVEAVPTLQELATDPDEGVRLHAIAALRSLGIAA